MINCLLSSANVFDRTIIGAYAPFSRKYIWVWSPLFQKAIRSGVTNEYDKKKDKHWELWNTFCVLQSLDPFLRGTKDLVPYLQISGARYRDERIVPYGKPVGSGTVSDAMRSVGHMYTRVGTPDLRIGPDGKLDFRISRQLRFYTRSDAPPNRMKPVPITLVIHALCFAFHDTPSDERQTVANMICITFFFCLRPGEYTGTTLGNQAFSLDDVAAIGSK